MTQYTKLMDEMFGNDILLTDSYKPSHWRQYPKDTENVYSFYESRGGKYPEITFFGLQYYLKVFLEGKRIARKHVDMAEELFKLHFGNDKIFNRKGWMHIVRKHGGRIPLYIKAVPEGMTIPVKNVLTTAEVTDTRVPWATNYFETILSLIWYPITVATQSREMKKVILANLIKTGTPELLPFKLHDFGFRGSTSVESSAIGGAAHLVNFQGTDTLSAIMMAKVIYHEVMAGYSIPAAEHSTITSWSKEHELDAYRNMLKSFPKGPVAIVADSYDVFEAARDKFGKSLKKAILKRDGFVVIRPDSGEPVSVILKLMEILGERFGYKLNAKGYKVLPNQVRIIQGDGIDYNMIVKILGAMDEAGWSGDNIAFGSGGGLLQKNLDRDTQKFAFKCAAILRSGVWIDVMKDPITDPGKKSKAGRMKLIFKDDTYMTVREHEYPEYSDIMVPVFRDGVLLQDYTFAEIRERAELPYFKKAS